MWASASSSTSPCPPCCINNIRKPETQSSVLSGDCVFLLCSGAGRGIIEHMIDFEEVCRMGDRVILHCDLNCFFASVELLSYPELREKPVAVSAATPPPATASFWPRTSLPSGWASRRRRPSGRPKRSVPVWYCCRPTTACTGSTPGGSTPSMSSIPIW